MTSTTFGLFRERNHALYKKSDSMKTSHETYGLKNGQTMKAMTDSPPRRQFFDVHQEYANIICDSDVSISDVTSERNCSVTEGYLSDDSDGVFISSDSKIYGNRKRRNRKQLDSHRHSNIVYNSDTEDNEPVRDKFVRKQKHKEPKSATNNFDYKNTRDGKLLYAVDGEVEQKRRSWTDSGVSSSRTDQSRSGTIGKDSLCSSPNKMFHFDHPEDDDDFDGKSSMKETDPDDTTPQENFDVQVHLSPRILRHRLKSATRDDVSSNRLSLITNKSSLTNVTVLSTNPSSCRSSISSLISDCTSLNYVTSATETKVDDSDESELDSKLNKLETTGRQISSVKDDIMEELSMNSTSPVNRKLEETDNSVLTDQNAIIEKLASTSISTEINFNKSNLYEPKKRDKNFFSSFRKVKDHLKPKFLSSKQCKDASKEFSFEKTEKDKHRQAFEELTTHVFGKLGQLDTNDEEFKRLSSAMDNFTVESFQQSEKASTEKTDDAENDLVKLSSRRPKHQTFLKKIFSRSKSYSAERVVKKSKTKDSLKRTTPERSSARSIPDHFGRTQSIKDNNRRTKSLENIEQHTTSASKSCDNINSMQNQNFNCNDCVSESEKMSRARSFTSLPENNSSSIGDARPRAKSNPNTPYMTRCPRPNTVPCDDYDDTNEFDSYDVDCDCDECLYAEYMEFLAFQQFKRTRGLPKTYGYSFAQPNFPQMQTQNSYPTTDHQSFTLHTAQGGSTVVAPLSVTVEKERQAKTLKTSQYDTFV